MAKKPEQPEITPGSGGNAELDKAVQERDREAVAASAGIGAPKMQTTYYKPPDGPGAPPAGE